jgi:hypothetical protein
MFPRGQRGRILIQVVDDQWRLEDPYLSDDQDLLMDSSTELQQDNNNDQFRKSDFSF